MQYFKLHGARVSVHILTHLLARVSLVNAICDQTSVTQLLRERKTSVPSCCIIIAYPCVATATISALGISYMATATVATTPRTNMHDRNIDDRSGCSDTALVDQQSNAINTSRPSDRRNIRRRTEASGK